MADAGSKNLEDVFRHEGETDLNRVASLNCLSLIPRLNVPGAVYRVASHNCLGASFLGCGPGALYRVTSLNCPASPK